MSTVQARFYVAEIHKFPSSMNGYADPVPNGRVVMRPVTRGSENKAWASATPAALFEMPVSGNALPWFEERLGKDVAITFEDRPQLCVVCKGELWGTQSAVDLGNDAFKHNSNCSQE